MSASEIANNKWELEVTKPKLATPGALAQMLMMVGFAGFFGYIILFSVIGMFSEKKNCVEVNGEQICGELAGKLDAATHSDGSKKKEAPAE